MNKSDTITDLITCHCSFWDTASQLPNPTMSQNGKWSVAQNVQHINIGLSRLSSYLALPKSSIEANFGISGRNSKSFEVMTTVFSDAFEKGIQSTDSFMPEENLQTKIEDLTNQGMGILKPMTENLQNWSEQELEKYNCPHPFLGKVTVREIIYFTIYHVQHHHKTIKKMRWDYLLD